MRIVSNFGKRAKGSQILETRKKVFFVFEGDKTEYQYFSGLINCRDDLGINSNYDFKCIVRSFDEQGWSNPKKLLNRFLSQSEQMSLTFEVLKELMCDYFISNKIVDAEVNYIQSSIESAFNRVFALNPDDIVEIEKEKAKIEASIKEVYTKEVITEAILEFIKDSRVVYEKDIDMVCLIVDRDKESFICRRKNNQYKYVVDKCNEKGIDLYITNPCFEFWLYLHFDDGIGLERLKLIENKRSQSNDETYIEHELKKYLPSYKKNEINFVDYKDKIEVAILNSCKYSRKIDELKSNAGTNIPELLKKLKE